MSVASHDASAAGGGHAYSLLHHALLFAALGWLVARVIAVIRRPKAELAEFIGLSEPARPIILVEGLGSSWASIYWFYPSSDARAQGKRRPKARKYVVEIGNQVIDVAREQRKVVVEGLVPDTSYKVTVKAVQAPATHAHAHHATSGIEEGISSILGAADAAPVIVSTSIYLHTLSSGPASASVPPASVLCRDTPLEPENAEAVKDVLAVQAETRSVLDQLDAAEAEFAVKYKALVQEYTAVNEQRKLYESQRAHIRSESKACEDRKHALDMQLAKLKQRVTKNAKYRTDIVSSTQELADLEQRHAERKREHQHAIDALEMEYHALAEREGRLARSAKDFAQRMKRADASAAAAREFIGRLKDTGYHCAGQQLDLLRSSGAAALGQASVQRIEHELQLDERIEREWVRAQKSLEQRYVDAYLMSSEKETRRLAQSELAADLPHLSSQVTPGPVMSPSGADEGSVSASGSPTDFGRQHASPSPGSAKDLSNHSAVLPGGVLPASPSPSTVPSYSSLQSLPSMSLRPSASIPSFESVPSMPSLRAPLPTSANAAAPSGAPPPPQPLAPMSINALHPFSSSSTSVPFGPPYAFGGQTFTYSGRTTPTSIEPDDAMLSPSAAKDLIPSNLFQDTDGGDFDAAGEDVDALVEMPETPRAPPRPAPKDTSPWLPWLSPHHRSHKRNSSLFFGSPQEANESLDRAVFTSYADTFEDSVGHGPEHESEHELNHGHEHEHEHEHGQEHETEHETEDEIHHENDADTSPNKTPRKRGGSRFFHKTGSSSSSRHGNFVRRLSIFSRKDEGAEYASSATNN